MEYNIGFSTIKDAEELLEWAYRGNPGPWLNHSKTVAKSARVIAEKSGLDSDFAYISGLLHDIGRYRGITGLRHIYDGYSLLNDKGYHYIAKICMTHSFPNNDYGNLDLFFGGNDCTEEEIHKIKEELDNYEDNDYDKLIQLCDSISLAEGLCILEIRLVDTVRRYRILNEYILKKWDAFFEIKKYFDNKCGKNIYKLFEEDIIRSSLK